MVLYTELWSKMRLRGNTHTASNRVVCLERGDDQMSEVYYKAKMLSLLAKLLCKMNIGKPGKEKSWGEKLLSDLSTLHMPSDAYRS